MAETSTDIPGIVVTGASGRMGQMLIRTILDNPSARLVGAVERSGHQWVGQDIGAAMGGAEVGVTVTDDALEAFSKAQAVIDFTGPEATLAFADLAAQARAVHVIGTTGMSDEQIAKLEPASRHCAQVRAGNMSLGVNLLVQLTKKVAAALDEDFDIEVIEAHHHHKVDAPSGTALCWVKLRPKGAVSACQRSVTAGATVSLARESVAISALAQSAAVTSWESTTCCLLVKVNGSFCATSPQIARFLRVARSRPRCGAWARSPVNTTWWMCWGSDQVPRYRLGGLC